MEEQNDQKTPEWLRRLEEESWQAELIISGLALYGSLQLPEFIYVIIDFLILHLPTTQYMTGYAITYGLLLGVSILSGFFIIHFVLRAYWIGLIGMNSVFPNGYDKGGGYFSKIYVRKFTALLPKVKDTIQEVDKICSTLFAGAFAFLMMYSMMSFVITVLLIIYNLLLNVTTSDVLMPFVYGIQVIFAGIVILSMIANMERFRENEQFQNRYFVVAKYFSYFMSPFFFKPINQITMTFFSSYEKGKSSLLLPTSFFLIAMTLSMTHIQKSNVRHLIIGGKSELPFFRKNKVYPEFYEEQHSEKKRILNPIIPSDQITGAFLKIFIPVFDNESFIEENFCEPYKNDDSKNRFTNRRLKREQMIFCYQKYHQIFINDSLYQVDFLTHDHSYNEEFGILGYIPTNDFQKGKNEVRIVKLETPEGTIYDELTIPFWFSKNNF